MAPIKQVFALIDVSHCLLTCSTNFNILFGTLGVGRLKPPWKWGSKSCWSILASVQAAAATGKTFAVMAASISSCGGLPGRSCWTNLTMLRAHLCKHNLSSSLSKAALCQSTAVLFYWHRIDGLHLFTAAIFPTTSEGVEDARLWKERTAHIWRSMLNLLAWFPSK